jgi:hypothetical protein
MMFNPMLILAVVLAFALSNAFSYMQGSKNESTRWEAKITAERLAATEAARAKEIMWQGVVNETAKNYETKVAGVRRSLDTALDSLRDRPERPRDLPAAARADVKDCNGAELARSHAEFLERYAAAAATQDAGLDACYAWADTISR